MIEIGKLPPQAVELEEAVLGAMLLEKEAVLEVIDILKPEHFYKENNGRVFGAIERIWKRNESPDILTVIQELKKTNELELVGGSYAISALTNRMGSSANIETHARIVLQKYMAREMIRISTATIKKAFEESMDTFDLMEDNMKEVEALTNKIVRTKIDRIDEIRDEVLEECRHLARTGKPSGVLCSIDLINEQVNGWQKTDLIILAARPGMGKTSAAIDFALTPALKGQPVAFFSLEMGKKQLASRILSIISEMNVSKIINKHLNSADIEQLKTESDILNKVPLFIDDTPALTITSLRNRARKLMREQKLELIVLDYLQLMSGDGGRNGNRETEIASISRGLKSLAKELDIPIIALSQVGRGCESKAGKMPDLSDLRESGAIEQDADIVIFMVRPDYYGLKEYTVGQNNYSGEDVQELLVFNLAKFRNGVLGPMKAKWIGYLTKITNWVK